MCFVHDYYCNQCGSKSFRTLVEACDRYHKEGCMGHEVGTKKYTDRCNICNPGSVFYSGVNPPVPVVAGAAAPVNRDFNFFAESAPRPADFPCYPVDLASSKSKGRPISEEMRRLGRSIKGKLLGRDEGAGAKLHDGRVISWPAPQRNPSTVNSLPVIVEQDRRRRKRSKPANGEKSSRSKGKQEMAEIFSAPAQAPQRPPPPPFKPRPGVNYGANLDDAAAAHPPPPPPKDHRFFVRTPLTEDNLRLVTDQVDVGRFMHAWVADSRHNTHNHHFYPSDSNNSLPSESSEDLYMTESQLFDKPWIKPGNYSPPPLKVDRTIYKPYRPAKKPSHDSFAANAAMAGMPGYHGGYSGDDEGLSEPAHRNRSHSKRRPRDTYVANAALAGMPEHHGVSNGNHPDARESREKTPHRRGTHKSRSRSTRRPPTSAPNVERGRSPKEPGRRHHYQ